MLEHYNDISFIMQSDFNLAQKYYDRIKDKEEESSLWDMWLSLYPSMMKKEIQFVSFSEFKKRIEQKAKEPVKTKKSEEELLSDAEKIKRQDIKTCK